MKSFKGFLSEDKHLLIERAEEVKTLVFNKQTHIPLSKKMMIRLKGGEAPSKYGIHITSIDNLDDLLRIQNSAKQISVMTSAGGAMESLLGGGVATEGGIWTIVHGYPVIESGSDFWSLQDTQGRRWIRIDNLERQAERSQNEDFYISEIEKLEESFWELKREILFKAVKKYKNDPWVANFYADYQDNKSLYQKRDVGDWMEDGISMYWRNLGHNEGMPMASAYIDSNPDIEEMDVKIDRKAKGFMISEFYKGTERILQRGFLDTIEDMMADTDTDKYGSWDEISMNDFEVVLIGVSDVDVARNAEQDANSAGIPIDAMYSETAENPEDFSYEALKIEMKAQQYFAALRGGSVIVEKNVENLIKEAVPPSERITLPDLSEKVEYVDSDLDNPDALLISLGGKVQIPIWTESVNLERYFSELELDRTQAPPFYYSNWFDEGEFVNPFHYKLLGIDEGVATGIWNPSQSTKKAFGIWMATVEQNPQQYNVEKKMFGRSNKLFAYGIAIALGTFGSSNSENIIIRATDAFIKNEEPDYKPSFYYQEAMRGV